jgi:hypothetical protein
VPALVDEIASRDGRVVEIHPEVSYRAMAGQPLEYSKKSWNGTSLRRLLLAQHGIVLPEDLGKAGLAPLDDVLDAAAAADGIARCAVCGCTEDRACPGGCAWAPGGGLIDVCTACVAPAICGVAGCGGHRLPEGADCYGWITAAVHGTGLSPAWYCSSACCLAAVRAQGDELAEADVIASTVLAGEAAAAGAAGRATVTVSVAGADRHLVLSGARIATPDGRYRLTGHLVPDSPTITDGWYRHLRLSTADGALFTAPEARLTVRTGVGSSTAQPRVLAVEWYLDGSTLTHPGGTEDGGGDRGC